MRTLARGNPESVAWLAAPLTLLDTSAVQEAPAGASRAADGRAESGVARDRPDHRTDSGAAGATGHGTLLGLGEASAAARGDRGDQYRRDECTLHFAPPFGHGALSTR